MSDDLFEFVRKFRPFGLKPLSSRDRVRDLLKFAKRRSGLKKGTTLFDLGDPSVRLLLNFVQIAHNSNIKTGYVLHGSHRKRESGVQRNTRLHVQKR